MADNNDKLAEAQSRLQRSLGQLEALPIVDVMGVVNASGASGGRSRGEDLWTLMFTLEAWRLSGAGLQTQPLNVRRKVTREELDRFKGQIKPYTMIRIKARVIADSEIGSLALLEAFVGIDTSDPELNDHADQLQKPVTYEDPVLGTFTLDRMVDWFTALVVWDGNSVSLNVSANESTEAQEALETAHSLWNSQNVWNSRIREYAAQKLLPLKNDAWLIEDEAELTASQFEDRMTLESITVYPDGSFDFSYNDGDLFWGHSIQISGSLELGPTDADIAG